MPGSSRATTPNTVRRSGCWADALTRSAWTSRNPKNHRLPWPFVGSHRVERWKSSRLGTCPPTGRLRGWSSTHRFRQTTAAWATSGARRYHRPGTRRRPTPRSKSPAMWSRTWRRWPKSRTTTRTVQHASGSSVTDSPNEPFAAPCRTSRNGSSSTRISRTPSSWKTPSSESCSWS